MTAEFNNPAARLHQLLSAWKAYNQQMTVKVVLCEALELDQSISTSDFLPYLGTVLTWPDQIAAQVDGLDQVNKALLMRWRPNVDMVMRTLDNLGTPVGSTVPLYNMQDLADLEHCAAALSYRSPEVTLPPDKLAELGELIREAIDAVIADTDLPDSARHWLVSKLRDVEQAVQHFRIAGYGGIQEAMERLTGGIVARPEATTETTKTWFHRIWELVMAARGDVHQLASTAQAVGGVIESGQNLFNGS